MKILHVLGSFRLPQDPDQEACSGIVRSALEIAKAQTKLGHKVWVAATGSENWEAEWQGVRLVNLRFAPWAAGHIGKRSFDFRAHIPLISLTYQQPFEVIHGHGYFYLRFLKAKVRLAHFHGDPFFTGSAGRDLSMQPADFRLVARITDAQIAVSQFTAGLLQRGLGARGNIHTVYNGVNHPSLSSIALLNKREETRRQWGIEENEIAILYCGAIVPEKGVIHLARAFKRLNVKHPTLHLVLAGSRNLWKPEIGTRDGYNYEDYEKEVRNLLTATPLTHKVHFMGLVNPVKMPAVYSASDIVVIPSICREGFPLVALEAMAFNCPIIASNTGGLQEVITPGGGLLVTPGDEAELEEALVRLIKNPDLRQSIKQQAGRTARYFTWEAAARRLDTIYQACLCKKSRICAPGRWG